MAQIHPKLTLSSDGCSSENETTTFTVWMKSLVLNGYGCTVYSSRGDVVFRVDNYQQRCCSNVLLMDGGGGVLFSLHKKRLNMWGCWEGYKWSDSSQIRNEKPWFEVRKEIRILRKNSSCKVRFGCDENKSYYRILGMKGKSKSRLKIVDNSGHLLAEVMEKQTIGGVPLGEDVLQLALQSDVDPPLIMALVTVHFLINHTL